MPLLKRKTTASGILKTLDSLYDDAKGLEKSNPEKAKSKYKKMMAEVSDLDNVENLNENASKISEILTATGVSLFALDDKESAIEFLEKAKSVDPKNAEALFNLGKVLVSQNIQLPYALNCLKEAISNDPKNTTAKILLADVYRLQEENDKALEIYKEVINEVKDRYNIINKILKLDPENREALLEKVDHLKSVNQLEELPDIYKKLALIDKNKEYLDKGLEIFPDNQSLMLEKAKFLIIEREYEQAQKIIFNVLLKSPDNSEALGLQEEMNKLMNFYSPEPAKIQEKQPANIFENIFETAPEKKEIVKSNVDIEHIKMDISTDSSTLEADLSNIKEDISILPAILKELKVPDSTLVRIVEYSVSTKNFELAKSAVDKIENALNNTFYNGYILFKFGKIDESEKFFNEVVKLTMNNGPTWYFKAAIMATKKNETACKNFLNMAIKNDQTLKKKAMEEEYFNNYKSSDWFKSLVS